MITSIFKNKTPQILVFSLLILYKVIFYKYEAILQRQPSVLLTRTFHTSFFFFFLSNCLYYFQSSDVIGVCVGGGGGVPVGKEQE